MDETKRIVAKIAMDKAIKRNEHILSIIERHKEEGKDSYKQEPLFKELAAEGYMGEFVASVAQTEYRKGYWLGIRTAVIGYLIGLAVIFIFTSLF